VKSLFVATLNGYIFVSATCAVGSEHITCPLVKYYTVVRQLL